MASQEPQRVFTVPFCVFYRWVYGHVPPRFCVDEYSGKQTIKSLQSLFGGSCEAHRSAGRRRFSVLRLYVDAWANIKGFHKRRVRTGYGNWFWPRIKICSETLDDTRTVTHRAILAALGSMWPSSVPHEVLLTPPAPSPRVHCRGGRRYGAIGPTQSCAATSRRASGKGFRHDFPRSQACGEPPNHPHPRRDTRRAACLRRMETAD